MIWSRDIEHSSSDTAKDALQISISIRPFPSVHRRTRKLSFLITTSISNNFTSNLYKMQLLSFSFVLLAALGAQAMPAKEGTVGLLALGVCIMSLMSALGHYANQSPTEQQCTAFEGQCLVNGRREICNIGKVRTPFSRPLITTRSLTRDLHSAPVLTPTAIMTVVLLAAAKNQQ
jgi:hypothetical protein